VQQSQHVSIDPDKIKPFAKNFPTSINSWMNYSPFQLKSLPPEQAAAFLFVFNAISFSYWGQPKWSIDNNQRGTWSMITALQRASQQGIPILDSNYLSQLETKDLGAILVGNTTIPLLEERASILRQVGETISTKYHHSFLEAIHQEDASYLVGTIVNDFPSFNDVSTYQQREIKFYKRAQLLVSDLSNQFPNKIKDADKLTACADYILPMVLRYYGILKYSRELANKVDTEQPLLSGSAEEVEIRANTLWTVELLKQESNHKFTSMQINDLLWIAGDKVPETEAYHLTRTTAY
jgi:hypothetical protein